MKSRSTLIVLNIFSVIIQTSFLLELFGTKLNPNLVATVVFSMLLVGDTASAYLSAFVGGLLLDIVSGGVIGLGAFLFTLFVWLYSHLHSFYLRNMFVSLFFATLYFYIFRLVTAQTLVFDGWIFAGSFLTAVMGQLLSLVFRSKSAYEKITY